MHSGPCASYTAAPESAETQRQGTSSSVFQSTVEKDPSSRQDIRQRCHWGDVVLCYCLSLWNKLGVTSEALSCSNYYWEHVTIAQLCGLLCYVNASSCNQ